MSTKVDRSKWGLLVLAGLALFAVALVVIDVERGLVFWYTALAGAAAVAVMAIWSRTARFALAGLLLGAVTGGALAAGLLWNEAAGSGWEDLVRAIAIMSGVMLGAVAGGVAGWLWAVFRKR